MRVSTALTEKAIDLIVHGGDPVNLGHGFSLLSVDGKEPSTAGSEAIFAAIDDLKKYYYGPKSNPSFDYQPAFHAQYINNPGIAEDEGDLGGTMSGRISSSKGETGKPTGTRDPDRYLKEQQDRQLRELFGG
jgi:hypothetical protein